MTIIIHQGSPDTLTTLFQQAAAAWSLLTSQSTMEAQFQVKLFVDISVLTLTLVILHW